MPNHSQTARSTLVKEFKREDEIQRLHQEIARLRRELDRVVSLYGLDDPRVIEIANQLDSPIARLMKLQLEKHRLKGE